MKTFKFCMLLLLTLSIFISNGCTTPPQKVIATACTHGDNYAIERCAKSIADVYSVYQKRIDETVHAVTTPSDVKTKLQRLDAAASPVIVELIKSTASYTRIKAQIAAGATQEEQLAIANQKLTEWVLEADQHVRALIAALGG